MNREYRPLVGGPLDGRWVDHFGDVADILAYQVIRDCPWEFMAAPNVAVHADVVEYYRWCPGEGHYLHEPLALTKTLRDSGIVWVPTEGSRVELVSPPVVVAFNPALDPIETTLRLAVAALETAIDVHSDALSVEDHETMFEAVRALKSLERPGRFRT